MREHYYLWIVRDNTKSCTDLLKLNPKLARQRSITKEKGIFRQKIGIIIIIIIIIIGIQPLGRSGQRPEFSQATGMALVRCTLGKLLGVTCHCFPPKLGLKKTNSIVLHLKHSWTLRKIHHESWKILKCSAGEVRRKSFRPIVREMQKRIT